MSQFVEGVEPATLGRFEGVKEDVGLLVPPQRQSIDLAARIRPRENTRTPFASSRCTQFLTGRSPKPQH